MTKSKMKNVAKIILLNNKNQFLLQLRDNKPKVIEPGTWDLFGGGIEKGENIFAGIERELDEELPGCLIKSIKQIGKGFVEIRNLRIANYWINGPYELKRIKGPLEEIQFFKGRILENIDHINKKITEGQKAGYFRLDELRNINLSDFVKEFINYNKEKIFS